jgi:hypothetical protein
VKHITIPFLGEKIRIVHAYVDQVAEFIIREDYNAIKSINITQRGFKIQSKNPP